MGNYVIGIGGTGAKFLESLTFLTSAGAMPSNYEKMYIMFVDPDKGNGNVDRTLQCINLYTRCKGLKFGSSSALFHTDIQTSDPDVWSPFNSSEDYKLEDFFQYHILDTNVKYLMDVLFSPSERKTELDRGFRGHPSIGSAVLADSLRFTENEPWVTFRNQVSNELNNNLPVNVFLVGSIFGGTGASGFPTIGALIKKEFPSISMAGALALPYFSFIADGSEDSVDEFRAYSEYFLVNTLASLEYYIKRNNMAVFDELYLVGEESLSAVKKFSLGAKTQENDSHFMEMYMSLAAINFFAGNSVEHFDGNTKCYIVGRTDPNDIEWKDIPYPSGFTEFKKKIAQFTRFAYIYVNIYFPDIEKIRAGFHKKIPWHYDYFVKKKHSVSEEEIYRGLEKVKDFCLLYLEWLKQVHSSYYSGAVKLLNQTALNQGDQRSFPTLILPVTEPNHKELDTIFSLMSHYNNDRLDASVPGVFLNALYDACNM